MTLAHALLRRLDLTTLQLFVAICEEGTLTRAAQREAIAPSAVSKRLAELERNLGVALLHRRPRGMVPTPAGETLLHHARQMMFKADQIAVELAEHAKGVRGVVRMLANLSAIVQFLPADLRAFLAREPAIRIDLEERPSGGVAKGVEDGWAEIGICAGTTEVRDLQSRLYRRDELAVVVPPDHPLAGRARLAFADTLDFDHVGLHAESSIYAQVRAAAHRSGRPLRLRVHAPSFDAVCRMAQAGMGLGIVPRLVFELLGPPMGLSGLPLTDDWAQRELHLVTRTAPLSPAGALLAAHLLADAN
jgi:DNA-binding transcriptional LysR family regulator